MAKRIVPLSDMDVRKAKKKDKQYSLFDGGGLYLLITPSGGKLWRLKYKVEGKAGLLAFGSYPEISLADARQRRDDARKLVANGVNPGAVKKAQKNAKFTAAGNSFEVIAREWLEKFSPQWSDSHRTRTTSLIARDLFPWIGSRPIEEIEPFELLATLRRIESRGAVETAYRARQISGVIFRYAIGTNRATRDPSADIRSREVFAKPVKGNYAAIIEPKQIAELMRAIDAFEGSFVVKSALRLAPLVFVRPGELRKAEWSEIDLEAKEWNIPAEKMKMKNAHLVPLSAQALEILTEIKPFSGHSKYVFPCHRSPLRPMSENAILAALRRIGYDKTEMTGHGFRAMARTVLDEILGFRPDFIEHQLAHAVKDPNGTAYNRTKHLEGRSTMMQTWADYLDDLKQVAKVIQIRPAEAA